MAANRYDPDTPDWWDQNAPPDPNNPTPPPPITNTDPPQRTVDTDARHGAGGSTSDDPLAWVDEALKAVQSTDDPAYWKRVISADPNGSGSAKDYWIDRINRGDGSILVKTGKIQKFNDSPSGMDPNGFGAAPPPFQNPALPKELASPYVAPKWEGGDFHAPTQAEVEATPGYQVGLDAGNRLIQRGAAAKGTILNPGTQEALQRFGQDYGSGQYQNTFANNYQQYMTKYGQFKDAASMGLGERNQNLGEYQTNLGNLYNQYMTNYNITHTAQNDYWSRLRDLYGIGANTATASKPAGT